MIQNRKYDKEIKAFRRKKFPFLNGFFKELRIKEITAEFIKESMYLIERLNISVISQKPKYKYLNEIVQETLNRISHDSKGIISLNYPKQLNEFNENFSIDKNEAKISAKKANKANTTTELLKQYGYKKDTYLCSKCNRFHKYLFQGKPSKTHLTHFKWFIEFQWKIPNYELFKMDFKKKWNKAKDYKV